MLQNYRLSIISAILLLSVISLKAQWGNSADSMRTINGASFGGGYTPFVYCSDGNNGVIALWVDGTHLDAQRVDATGHLRWGTTGIQVYDSTGSQLNPKICSDGHGGCFVVWVYYRVVNSTGYFTYQGQRIDSNGNALWQHNGKQVVFPATGTFSATNLDLINNNGNGAFLGLEVGWNGGLGSVRAAKIDLSGKPLWDSSGVAVTPVYDYRNPRLLLDGYGGMEMIYFSDVSAPGNIMMQRIDSTGNLRWGSGIGLNTFYGITDGAFNICHTGSTDVVATWDGYLYHSGVYAQKIDTGGNFLWGTHEVYVCDTPANQYFPDVMSDGLGGAYFAWSDSRTSGQPVRIYVQRLNAAGVEQWPHNGIAVDTLNTYNPNPSLSPDVSNGLRVFWPSIQNGEHVRMQRLDLNGNILCDINGKRVTPYNTQTILYGHRSVQNRNSGGDLVLGYNTPGIYAQYVPAGCDFPPLYNACDSIIGNFGSVGSASVYQFSDSSFANGGTIQSWKWNFGDSLSGVNDSSILQNPSHVFSAPGTYIVCLTVTGGIPNSICGITNCKTVTITPTGIANNNPYSCSLYPNPTKGSFTLVIGETGQDKMLLSMEDVFGRIVNTGSVKSGFNSIDAGPFASGIYIVTLHSSTSEMLYQQRVVIAK
ncbi:MAG: hypothetical protein JWO06_3312 [Bacteroidota bacterium]|nr:hypothetical protein [Bacteroidota bacterium]